MPEVANVDLFIGDDLIIREALTLYKTFLMITAPSPKLSQTKMKNTLKYINSALTILKQENQGLTANECRMIYISLQFYSDDLAKKLTSPFADQITMNLYATKRNDVERIKSQYALIFKNNGIDVKSFF